MSIELNYHPLHKATLRRSLTEMRALLDQGCSVNELNWEEETAMCVAIRSEFVDGVKLLLERGADLKNSGGHGLLNIAASIEDFEIFQLLLENGANLEEKDTTGQSPLIYTVKFVFKSGFQLLLSKGVNVNVRDDSGNTPLHYAAMHCAEFIQPLLDSGANIESMNEFGKTAVVVAVQRNQRTSCKILIERGACVNVQSTDGCSPLHIAAEEGYYLSMELLLKNGAMVNARDEDGWTPMHYVSISEDEECFRMLLDSGASLDIVDDIGERPMDRIPDVELWIEELQRMKTLKICRWSLYDVFRQYDRRDPAIAGCSEMAAAISSSQLKTDFPYYKSSLKSRFRFAKRRYDLLSEAQNHLCPLLPEEIRRLILSYLGKKDLKYFIMAYTYDK